MRRLARSFFVLFFPGGLIMTAAVFLSRRDPELIALAEKTSHPIDYVDGETAATYAKDILDLPPEVLDKVKKGFGME